jgi:hypothetical protein
MTVANKKAPYIVREFTFSDFIDFVKTNREYMKQNAIQGIPGVHHIEFKKCDTAVTARFFESTACRSYERGPYT